MLKSNSIEVEIGNAMITIQHHILSKEPELGFCYDNHIKVATLLGMISPKATVGPIIN
jgi:hypothetical protein